MTVPEATALSIYERDNYRCRYCGEDVGSTAEIYWRGRPTVDHLKPVSSGGNDDANNLYTSCGSCNAYKGKRTFNSVDDVRAFIAKYKIEEFGNWYHRNVRP